MKSRIDIKGLSCLISILKPWDYLIWYSADMIDKNKLVVDRFRNEYVDLKVLYIGNADELDRRIGGLTPVKEFFLPSGARIMAAGTK